MFASLSQSLDNDWQTFIRQKPEIGTKTMEEIFQILEDQMLIAKPMSSGAKSQKCFWHPEVLGQLLSAKTQFVYSCNCSLLVKFGWW